MYYKGWARGAFEETLLFMNNHLILRLIIIVKIQNLLVYTHTRVYIHYKGFLL